jgi:hypothetical protein
VTLPELEPAFKVRLSYHLDALEMSLPKVYFCQRLVSFRSDPGYRSALSRFAFSNILLSLFLTRNLKETERLVADPAPGITAEPHEDNLRYFDVTIQGPDGSPFQSAFICIRALAQSLSRSLQMAYFASNYFYQKNILWRLRKFGF